MVFLPAEDDSVVSAASFGDGDHAAVFVHQTGITGLCGWVPYAAWAARHGIRAVVVDVCGYGRSQCSEALDADPAAQLALPVAWAREQGATSVTLVGASMGGSLVAGAGDARPVRTPWSTCPGRPTGTTSPRSRTRCRPRRSRCC